MSQEVFTEIYSKNHWKSNESRSGTGSELKATKNIRKELPKLFKKYAVHSVLDIGCGDFNWMRNVVSDSIYYRGVDIVSEIININTKLYSTQKISFGRFNSFLVALTCYDLVLIRDVLVHYPFAEIEEFLKQFSGCKVLMTHFTDQESNRDIVTGAWRSLNMEIEPFNLGSPLEIIKDDFEVSNKTLSLWQL